MGHWRGVALAYLRAQLRDDAPQELGEGVAFTWSPLEGDGLTVVFEFFATRGTPERLRFFVVTGETEANYYPAEDLTAEEAFELHLGTRFMLVIGISQVPIAEAERDPTYDAARDADEIVGRVARDALAEDLQIAAMFRVAETQHAVLRCRIKGEPVYIMGRDAPQGFSKKVHLHPHVAYRLHIGHVLRREAKPDS